MKGMDRCGRVKISPFSPPVRLVQVKMTT